jgi:hypothetical protein
MSDQLGPDHLAAITALFGDSGHIARAMRNADDDPGIHERPIAMA